MTADVLLVLIGFLAGLIGTIIGAGGGFLIIPFLLLNRHFTPQTAIGTSLAVVFLNTLSGSYAYARQKRVEYASAWRFAAATIPGAILGSYIAQYYTGTIYRLVFGIFLSLIASYVFYRSFEKTELAVALETASPDRAQTAKGLRTHTDAAGNTYTFAYNLRFGVIASFGVGFLASTLGIGGGIIHVPMLIYVLGFPAHLATATSYFILAISTFFGSLPHLAAGNVDFSVVPLLAVGAIAGGQVGAHLSKKIKGPNIIRALALALFYLSIRLMTS